MEEKKFNPILDFDRRCKCDWCGNTEICAVTTYGTTHYNRLICVECAMSFNQQNRWNRPYTFDLNKSTIRFRDFTYDIEKEEEEL